MGIIDARQGPIPANIESLFPDPWNADTWNLAAHLAERPDLHHRRRPEQAPLFTSRSTRAWVQDDWQLTSKLTLNLGVRYDLIWDAFANWVGARAVDEAPTVRRTRTTSSRASASRTR